MKLKIPLYKPRSTSVTSSTIQVGDIISKSTFVTQRDRKTAIRNIPVSAKIHLQTLINLSLYTSETRSSSLLPVAIYLLSHLRTENCQDIEVKVEDIIFDLKLSDKSVTKAIDFLEEKELVARKGRGKFRVSPRLAFYGQAFDWSIALQYEKEGDAVIQAKIAQVNEQIKEADGEHLKRLIEAGIPNYIN